jgi:prenyltransferase beta subunit
MSIVSPIVRLLHLYLVSVYDTYAENLVILSLQSPSGAFMGDKWGETDTRFTYCAINALSLLGTLHKKRNGEQSLDIEKTVQYFKKCRNYDGGFGNDIGGESHSAQGESFVNADDGFTPIKYSVYVRGCFSYPGKIRGFHIDK